MSAQNRCSEDKFEIEPTTQDDYLKAIWKDMQSVKKVCFDPQAGLVNRVTIIETVLKFAAWVIGVVSVVGGWFIYKKDG